MAGSRLEKLGTIFTRVNGLIKSGAMKVDDRPIWYDVYRAFPPESEPHYAKPAQTLKIPDIFYQEDVFRAEFHKKTRGQLPPIVLKDTHNSQNATKVAVEMAAADQSLTVDQIVDALKKNNVLPVYNVLSRKVNSARTADGGNVSKPVDKHNVTAEKKI